ncbi:tRNA (adenine(22)-N(1))-methyltransferase [Cohnella abietis]|uniref:tRNA (Adenine(22)-N(1))-methyltransferase n=1 Tax=Cohnella abietis TaxID=2507935 RepID=A0A3T1D9G1_9BACL|nr:class I SAM-dependent methyltransferase [Cohnella abietis]BBI34714.1 tRNA (adenine(22)-N(1))-methyltransferase [Cohnella abietis]
MKNNNELSKNIDGVEMKLSRRLSALAEWVPEGARFADIGTDHALLPVFLAKTGKISYAVAGDVHDGPVEAAKRQVSEADLGDIISVRIGDGLSVLEPGEVDTVTIAGMGGSLMARILEQGKEQLKGVTTLVLSPHVAEDAVRQWLVKHDYVIDREILLEEDGVIYTLMRATLETDSGLAQAEQKRLYDEAILAPSLLKISSALLYEMGPLLLREPTEAFHLKWEQEIAKRERVILQLSHATASEAAEKAREWEEDVREIREVLSCLPVEKR